MFHNPFQNIPEIERTEAFYLSEVKKNGKLLEYVPKSKYTEAIGLAAVQQNEWALEFVPIDQITDKLCFTAVKKNGQALQIVPPNKITEEICLSAIQGDWSALEFVPANFATEKLWLQAINNNGKAIQYIPSNRLTEKLCLTALEQNGLALQYVPPRLITEKICLTAVEQNGLALEDLPPSAFSEKICIAAIKQNGDALLYVPTNKRSEAMYLVAVQQKGTALQHVPENERTEKLCKIAIQQNGLALQYVIEENRTNELILIAVQQDGLALQYVPENKRTEKIYQIAVKQNGLALQYIPKEMRTPEIYLEAVRQNGRALEWVPEEEKASIIKILSAKEIIAKNYQAINYFPKGHHFQEEINKYLATVDHVLLNMDSSDHELYDIQTTYANKKNRKSVCINGSKNSQKDLAQLLTDIEEANNTHILHLGLIDHANVDSTQLSGISFQQIPKILKQHPTIQHVHLLGCNVAKANISTDEKNIIETFQKKSLKDDKLRYGFVSASTKEDSINEGMQKKCVQLCRRNNLNGVYILNKKDEKTYVLFSIKYDFSAEKIAKITMKEIPSTRITNLKHILDNQKKELSFPKSPGELINIRDKKPLSVAELQSLRSTAYEADRFDRAHPKYKSDKTRYPFLAKVKVEVDDLQDSLIQKMANEISVSEIDRDITLHGATKALHVDTAKRDFKVTRTHLYPSSYKQSLFESRQPNIDQKKLNEERKKEIIAMKEGKIEGESHAKGIIVTVKKK